MYIWAEIRHPLRNHSQCTGRGGEGLQSWISIKCWLLKIACQNQSYRCAICMKHSQGRSIIWISIISLCLCFLQVLDHVKEVASTIDPASTLYVVEVVEKGASSKVLGGVTLLGGVCKLQPGSCFGCTDGPCTVKWCIGHHCLWRY